MVNIDPHISQLVKDFQNSPIGTWILLGYADDEHIVVQGQGQGL